MKSDPRLAYVWFWVWLFVVSATAIWIYREAAGLTGVVLVNLIGADTREFVISPFLQLALFYVAGLLLWWRIVKVIVLHGAPISLGMEISSGRQDEGNKGRIVTMACIGDPWGSNRKPFFYGTVFKAHPSSDKLMRSRLELLVLALPFGITFVVNESRLFFKKYTENNRSDHFKNVASKYMRKSQSTSDNKLRLEIVNGMKALQKMNGGD